MRLLPSECHGTRMDSKCCLRRADRSVPSCRWEPQTVLTLRAIPTKFKVVGHGATDSMRDGKS